MCGRLQPPAHFSGLEVVLTFRTYYKTFYVLIFFKKALDKRKRIVYNTL